MTSVKLFARASDSKKDGKVQVYLQLIHLRKPKYIPLDIYVTAKAFDFSLTRCTPAHPKYLSYNSKLTEKEAIATHALLPIADHTYTADEVVALIKAKLRTGGGPITLQVMADEMIERNRKADGDTNADIIKNVVGWFNAWNGGDAAMTSITYKTLLDYKAYLMGLQRSNSTISNYLRTIRAVFKYAIDSNQIPPTAFPFKRGLIPAGSRGQKKKFDIQVISALEKLAPSLEGFMQVVAHTTLLQFYFQGWDLVEVVRLKKKEDIQDGYVSTKRYKTRKKDNQPTAWAKIIPKAQAIIGLYPGPFITPVCEDIDMRTESVRYKTRRRNFNRSLALISERLKLEKPLTCKSVRYIWATEAANLRVPEDIRMRAQGQKIPGVAEGYVDFNPEIQAIVDEANAKVCKIKAPARRAKHEK